MSKTTGDLTGLFGTVAATVDYCVEFAITAAPATWVFDLASPSIVSYVWVNVGDGFTNAETVDVEVQDMALTWTSCPQMDFNAGLALSSYCGGLGAKSIRLTLVGSYGTFKYMCRVGIFGESCASIPPTITEDPFTGGTTTFDLLVDTTANILLPTLSATPEGCYSKVWTVSRVSDNSDMELNQPTVYVITDPNLVLSHTVTDYAARLTLFGSESLQFQATLSDDLSTPTSLQPFSVSFTDACRTATVVPQTITYTSVQWNVDTTSTLTVPAFTDDVDGTGSYTLGICGEKKFALDPSTPSFLTMTPGVDPVLDPFTINYSEAFAIEADDILVHTITYTVTILEYTGIATVYTSTFDFEIRCPDFVVTSTLDAAIEASSDYDVASGATLSLTAPVVSVTPAVCFTVASYYIVDDNTGAPPEFLSVNGYSTVDIFTADRAYIGTQSLTI